MQVTLEKLVTSVASLATISEARVKKTVDDAQVNLQVATTDWRFWLGILAVLSVGTALLGHTPSGQTYSV